MVDTWSYRTPYNRRVHAAQGFRTEVCSTFLLGQGVKVCRFRLIGWEFVSGGSFRMLIWAFELGLGVSDMGGYAFLFFGLA